MAECNIGISSWTLHRLLTPAVGERALTLFELPALIAQHGYFDLEICDFHIESTETAYLRELRSALRASNIRLKSLLLDTVEIDALDTVKHWIDAAVELEARAVRVIAGKVPANDTSLRESAAKFNAMTNYAALRNVTLSTENWFELLNTPLDVIKLLDLTSHQVELKLDFGNWPAPRRYDDLPIIAPYATTSHAKLHIDEAGNPDFSDFDRILRGIHAAGFKGEHILVYDGSLMIWPILSTMRSHVARFVNPT